MDDRNFDSLARALSGASPRRQLLRWVSGLLAGSVAGAVGLQQAAAACKQASDCPPPADPCKKAVCKNGTCADKALPKGVPCGDKNSESSNLEETGSDIRVQDAADAGNIKPRGDGGEERDGSGSGDRKPRGDGGEERDGSGSGDRKPRGDGKKSESSEPKETDSSGAKEPSDSKKRRGADAKSDTPGDDSSTTDTPGGDSGQLGESTDDERTRAADRQLTAAVSADAICTKQPGDVCKNDEQCCNEAGEDEGDCKKAGDKKKCRCDDGRKACKGVCCPEGSECKGKKKKKHCSAVSGCTSPADCPTPESAGLDAECATPTCTSETCGFDFATAGTTCNTDDVCDGAGNCVDCVVAGDCPTATEAGLDAECATPTCTSETCGFDFATAGTTCNTDDVCDGAGNCVDCVVAGDCPTATEAGLDAECATPTCTSETCGFDFATAGTTCNTDDVCDGAGNCVDCVVAGDCPTATEAGLDAECATPTCTSETCGFDFATAGTTCNTDDVCDGAGNCVDCVVAGDCPTATEAGLDAECATPTCTSETCGFDFATAGTTCNTDDVCDGAGNCVDCVVAGDCPTATEAGLDAECATPTCTSETCGFDFATAGTTCNTDDVCDGAGNCVDCVVAGDCPTATEAGLDAECATPTCTSETCGFDFATAGTTCNTDDVCDGAGNCVDCVVAGDCPTATEAGLDAECATPTCTSETCGFDFATAGTTCNTDDVCDGAGNCVDCVVAGDCPTATEAGLDAECATPTCTSETCGFDFATAGTTCNTDDVCDGAGNCVDCVVAGDCPTATEAGLDAECATPTCTSETCGFDFATAGTTCNTDDVCDGAGNCVDCVVAGDCPTATEAGFNAACATPTCSATGECGFTFAGVAVTCDDGNECTLGDHCNGSGACVGTTNAPANTACGPVGDRCANSCNGTGTCTTTDVVCPPAPGQCFNAGTCDSGTGICGAPTPRTGLSCDDGNPCTTGETCNAAGICQGGTTTVGVPCGTACCTGLNGCCPAGTVRAGTCSRLSGTSCTNDNQCCSNSCPGTGSGRTCA